MDDLETYEQSTDWNKRLWWILNGIGTKAQKRQEIKSLKKDLNSWAANYTGKHTPIQVEHYLDIYYSRLA